MKKRYTSETVMLVSGVLFAVLLSFVWLINEISPFTITMRTVAEAKAFWWQSLPGFDLQTWNKVGEVFIPVLLLIYCVALVRSMNPDFNLRKLKTFRGIVLWPLAVAGVFAALAMALWADLFYTDRPVFAFHIPANDTQIVGLALTWLVVGAAAAQGKAWKKHLFNFITGAAIGLVVLSIRYMDKSAGDIVGIVKYVYHGGPYEYNPYVLNVAFTFTFLKILLMTGWVAGMAMASSRDIQRGARIRWAGVSIASFLVFFLFIGIVYLDNRAEWNEMNSPFASVTGISVEKQPPRQMVFLRDASGEAREWPSEFTFMNPIPVLKHEESENAIDFNELYPATNENLLKLTKYLEQPKFGIYQWNYTEALIDGYYAILEEQEAKKTIVRFAHDLNIYRMMTYLMFSIAPVTPENKGLLVSLEEGNDWNEDLWTSRNFCITCQRMGIEEKAKKWCDIYREVTGEELEPGYELVNGIIKGNITLDKVPFTDGKIVLFRAEENINDYLDPAKLMAFRMLATAQPGPHGEFEFNGLKNLEGQGYELTVVFDTPLKQKITGIDNPPGIINVTSAENYFDLGTINIRTEKN